MAARSGVLLVEILLDHGQTLGFEPGHHSIASRVVVVARGVALDNLAAHRRDSTFLRVGERRIDLGVVDLRDREIETPATP